MAQLSLATGNKVLGAALCAVVERMPRRERPFSTAELADRLVGEETREVQRGIERIRTAAQRAININREFEGGRRRTTERVRLALREREDA